LFRSWEQSPTEISGDTKTQVLILAQPLESPSPEEKTAVLEFLQKGGRVVASGWGASRLLPQAAPPFTSFAMEEDTKFPALLPSPLVRGAPEISMVPPAQWHPQSRSLLVV